MTKRKKTAPSKNFTAVIYRTALYIKQPRNLTKLIYRTAHKKNLRRQLTEPPKIDIFLGRTVPFMRERGDDGRLLALFVLLQHAE